MEENKTEREQNEDESQQNKKWIESLRFENLTVEERRTHEERWRTTKKSSWNCSQKHLGTVMKAPWLGFSSRKYIFSPKIAKMYSMGVKDPLEQPPLPYLSKNGEEVAAQLDKAS